MDRRKFLAAAATPLVLGVVPPAFAKRSGGLPLALVTADLESSVVAVELSSGRVYRRLQTPGDPRSIESIGGIGAIVAHTELGASVARSTRSSPSTRSGDLSRRRATPPSPMTCASPMSPTRRARRWRSSTCVPAGSFGASRSEGRHGISPSTCSGAGCGSCSAARAPRSRSSASTIRAARAWSIASSLRSWLTTSATSRAERACG